MIQTRTGTFLILFLSFNLVFVFLDFFNYIFVFYLFFSTVNDFLDTRIGRQTTEQDIHDLCMFLFRVCFLFYFFNFVRVDSNYYIYN